jgi:plastocyanin
MKTSLPVLLLLAVLALSGCDQRSTSSAPPAEKPKPQEAAAVDMANAATISGVVNFTGAEPPAQKVDVSLDPACSLERDPVYAQQARPIQAKDGKLANVYVYVKRGLPDGHYPAPADKVIVDQKGCQYSPHVVGLMVGQTIEFHNSSVAEHNIHAMPTDSKNAEFNEVQSPKGSPVDKSFSGPEVMMPIKCNQHPWMRMYASVSTHPFFAVTGPDGRFELKGLPPGTYLIAAIHEKLGLQTTSITVAAKEKKEGVEFNFKQ